MIHTSRRTHAFGLHVVNDLIQLFLHRGKRKLIGLLEISPVFVWKSASSASLARKPALRILLIMRAHATSQSKDTPPTNQDSAEPLNLNALVEVNFGYLGCTQLQQVVGAWFGPRLGSGHHRP